MKTRIYLAAGTVILIVMVFLAGCSSSAETVTAGQTNGTPQAVNVNVGSQQTGIWVNGTGKKTVTPDLAVITLGVSSQTTSVAESQANASEAMDKIMKALADQGVAKNDIQTRYFDIQQVTRWDDKGQIETIVGYRVSNSVIAKLRDMDKVGKVIDAVVEAGGDLTRISGINFSVEKPEKYYQEVRDLAMKDAKVKAEQIATLSGVTLGKPTYVSENSGSQGTYYPAYKLDMAASGGSGVSTAVSAGEMDITLNVQVAYDIQ